MSEFANQVVVVTGAAGGIGQALCRRFADAGATLIAVDRVAVEGLAAPHRAIVADVTDGFALTQALRDAAKTLGRVDVLINNAGGATKSTLAETDAASWRREIALNLDGAYHCVEAVRPTMMAQRAGAIVNIGSVNGLMMLGHPAYSAGKAALISYTKAIAVEFGRHGIRANVICPGTVRTKTWAARVARDPQIFERLRKWYPLDRVVEPSEIAEVAAFLASPRAAAITGAMLPVDCGLMAGNAVMARELTLSEF